MLQYMLQILHFWHQSSSSGCLTLQVLEEEAAMAASAAMAETVLESLGQALTQPAPRSARAGLQV